MRAASRKTLIDVLWAIVYVAMAGVIALLAPALSRGGEHDCRLLDFYSDWCGPCQSMRTTVDAIAQAGYTVDRINIDQNPVLAQQFTVTSIPCFVAIVDGRETDRVVGAVTYERLESMVKKVASGKRETKKVEAQLRTWRYESAVSYRASVVRIFCETGAASRSIGSGTLVRWNGRVVVLTARHVVKDATRIVVELGTKKRHAATVIKVDAVWDCAVLELAGLPEGVEAAEVELGAEAMQHDGDALESCGYGPDGKLACNSGQFLGYKRSAQTPNGPDDWLVISGHARGGDSGGPVFNKRGRLVGVLWGTDGKEVVCVQAGRLHVLLDAAVPPQPAKIVPQQALQASLQRTPTPAKDCGDDACACEPTMNRAQPECLEKLFGGRRQAAAPNVIVQPDPEARRALENIDAKVGVLIDQRRPTPAQEAHENEPSPLVAGLCILAAVAVGFVVYFSTQKS